MDAPFFAPLDRTTEQSVKWDEALARTGPGSIPLDVADMDFPAPPEVVAAVTSRAARGAYGYTQLTGEFACAVRRWQQDIHRWEVPSEHIVYVPRVVEAWPLVLDLLSRPGDGVLVHSPSYGPLTDLVEANGRRLVRSPLVERGGRHRMDLDETERILREEARVLLLVNPHNPTGRCWDREELAALADIVVRTGARVVSDEIHSDLVHAGRSVTPFAAVCEAAAAQTITFRSPAKTFNLAGLEVGYAIISDPATRQGLVDRLHDAGVHNPSYFAQAALVAAYTRCDDWYGQLLGLVDEHLRLLTESLATELRGVRLITPEATYLAWLDMSAWGTDQELDLLCRQARVALSPGHHFGPGQEGFMRISLGTSTPLLQEAIARLGRVNPIPPTLEDIH